MSESHDAADTEREMREHEAEARERDSSEKDPVAGMADGVTGDKDDPDDAAPPGTAARGTTGAG